MTRSNPVHLVQEAPGGARRPPPVAEALFEVERTPGRTPEGLEVRWAVVTCPHGERLAVLVTSGPDARSTWGNVWHLEERPGGRCAVRPSILWQGGSGSHRNAPCHFGPGEFPMRWTDDPWGRYWRPRAPAHATSNVVRLTQEPSRAPPIGPGGSGRVRLTRDEGWRRIWRSHLGDRVHGWVSNTREGPTHYSVCPVCGMLVVYALAEFEERRRAGQSTSIYCRYGGAEHWHPGFPVDPHEIPVVPE